MPISAQKARALLTKSEYALFRDSLPSNIGALTPAVLKRDVARARTLRDKYRKLAERQRREAKGSAKPRGKRRSEGAANTQLKAQLFSEALERFQAGLDPAEKKAASKAKKPAKKRPPGRKTVVKKKAAGQPKAGKVKKATKAKAKSSTGKTAIREKAKTVAPATAKTKPVREKRKQKRPKPRVGKGSFVAELLQKQSRVRRSGSTRIRTHVSARGRRQQARRDSRSR